MRIISKAANEIKCNHCRTHFEFEDSDIRHKVEPPGYDEYENRDVYFVKCPTCGTEHGIRATGFQRQNVENRKRHEWDDL